ncbi:MAG TPA: DNA photolyase [Clostridiaceae bacterium]|nr:DNA photolyase [Clostridiaceae bacterium]
MFNTIYIEEKAYEYHITRQLLHKYVDSEVVTIRHYKDVFNRPKQNLAVQKRYPSLILAVKDGQFLYEGPVVCQSFDHPNFYYTSFLLNCVFDCEYCFLQGMYPSANIVAFVNVEDFKEAMKDLLHSRKKVFLAVSYDTDLIAFHNIIPYLQYFYDFFASHPDMLAEVRTKSANQAFYNDYQPLKNLIIAFTLAPDEIIKKYERHTPSLKSRINAVKAATARGFSVRICFDPVFADPEMEDAYKEFYHHVFTQIDPGSILDVGYGFFRMPVDFFKRIEKVRSSSLLYAKEYFVKGNVVSYPEPVMERIKTEHLEILEKYIKKEKIFTL